MKKRLSIKHAFLFFFSLFTKRSHQRDRGLVTPIRTLSKCLTWDDILKKVYKNKGW